MSHTIFHQTMCVKFSNGMGCLISQAGDNNTSDIVWSKGKYREVIARDWQIISKIYSDSQQRNCLVPLKDMPNNIHANLLQMSNNNLNEIADFWAYKSSYAFKPYIFWERHFKNAINRYSMTASDLIKRGFTQFTVVQSGNASSMTVHDERELYQFLERYNTHTIVVHIPREFSISQWVCTHSTSDGKALGYYLYNPMERGVYCKLKGSRKGLTLACLSNNEEKYNVLKLDDNLIQYYMSWGGSIKKVLTFKSLGACINYFIPNINDPYFMKSLTHVYIGEIGKVNKPTEETLLVNYLQKSINYIK